MQCITLCILHTSATIANSQPSLIMLSDCYNTARNNLLFNKSGRLGTAQAVPRVIAYSLQTINVCESTFRWNILRYKPNQPLLTKSLTNVWERCRRALHTLHHYQTTMRPHMDTRCGIIHLDIVLMHNACKVCNHLCSVRNVSIASTLQHDCTSSAPEIGNLAKPCCSNDVANIVADCEILCLCAQTRQEVQLVLCTAYVYIMFSIQAEPATDCKCTESISKRYTLNIQGHNQPITSCTPECTILQQCQSTCWSLHQASHPAYAVLLKITILRLASTNMMQATSAIQSW